eukprot:4707886-Prymnesium_polylepis.1
MRRVPCLACCAQIFSAAAASSRRRRRCASSTRSDSRLAHLATCGGGGEQTRGALDASRACGWRADVQACGRCAEVQCGLASYRVQVELVEHLRGALPLGGGVRQFLDRLGGRVLEAREHRRRRPGGLGVPSVVERDVDRDCGRHRRARVCVLRALAKRSSVPAGVRDGLSVCPTADTVSRLLCRSKANEGAS